MVYQLESFTKKSISLIPSDLAIPEEAKYIIYQDEYFQRCNQADEKSEARRIELRCAVTDYWVSVAERDIDPAAGTVDGKDLCPKVSPAMQQQIDAVKAPGQGAAAPVNTLGNRVG